MNEMPDDVCRDFLRNVCNRGKTCRFQHPVQFGNLGNNGWNPLDERQNFCKGFCHDFQNVGCNRDDCKYVHCSKEDHGRFLESGQMPTYVLEDAITKAVIPFLPGGVPVCRDYLNGECRRGKSCRFRHLSHCKYKKELDVLFGVQSNDSTTYPEAKRTKLSFSSCPTYPIEKTCSSHNNCSQGHFSVEKCNGHVRLSDQHHVHSSCQRVYTSDSCCDRVQDHSNSLQEENNSLKKQVFELRRQVNDLLTANEYLLDQNATLRMMRKNGSVVTPATLNVHPAPGQQIVASAVPVSIAPVTGPGPMAISTVAMTAQPNTQQLVPVSCHAAGQQIMAAVNTVTVAGQTGSGALLATAVPVSSTASQLVPVSAVPVSLATVSMAPMHMPPIATAASSIAMSASAGVVSYPIMTQPLLQTR